MEFTDQDIIKTASVFKHGLNSPCVNEELAILIEEKCSHIAEHHEKDDEKFRKNCVEVLQYFYDEHECWELMLLIVELSLKNIFIRYKVVPEYGDLVDNYKALLSKAKQYMAENDEY